MSSRPKIVLYNPQAVFFDMPLALLSIGSMLDATRFECVIVDGRLEQDAWSAVERHLDGALCLGVTVLTGSPIRDALRVSRRAKASRPDLKVVWGGWHPSLFPEDTLQDETAIDCTVQGQGEETFRELVDAFDRGLPLGGVNGIVWRRGGELVKNPPRAMTGMNALPPVDYRLIDVPRYFEKKKRRQFDYISSTGCFFRCSFCADPFVFGRQWTSIEPRRMGQEIAAWQERYAFTDLNFQDETFFTYRERAVSIAREFVNRRLGITWAATMRADQGTRLSDRDFELLKQSGLRRLLIGVESGSQEMIDWMQKDIRIDQVWDVAERCRRLGIDVIFPFIVGFPGESDESIERSLNMAAQLRQMAPGFSTPVFYFKPYPGSQITREVEANGYALPGTLDEWADFDYIGSAGPWMSADQHRHVESFKFYNRIAGGPRRLIYRPLQKIARWRLRTKRFGLPIEKIIVNALKPEAKLS